MRVLNLDNQSFDLKNEIEKDGGWITDCIQCGACMSICPVALSGFEFPNKRLFKLIMLGLEEEVLEHTSPWICVSCMRCERICPRNVSPHSIYFALRRYQSRRFRGPEIFRDGVWNIHQFGFKIEPDNGKREEHKLKLIIIEKDHLEEVRKLMEDSILKKLGVI